MSTPGFFKRIDAQKKRRAGYVDHSLSGHGGGGGGSRPPAYQLGTYGDAGMGGGMWPRSGIEAMAGASWRPDMQPMQQHVPAWTADSNSGYLDFSDDRIALNNAIAPTMNQPFFAGGAYNAYANPQQRGVGGGRPSYSGGNVVNQNPDPVEYKISPSALTCFFGRRHYLSTLYPCRIVVEGYDYPSVEHYYQACKLYTLGGSHLALNISRIQDPAQCKVQAKLLLQGVADKRKVDEWKRREAPEILLNGIVRKFEQHPALRQQLLATADSMLVHSYDKDNLYANGLSQEETKKWFADNKGKIVAIPALFSQLDVRDAVPTVGKGRNLLGVIHMQVREAFRPERGHADPRILQLLANDF